MAFRSGSSLGYTATTSAAVPVPTGAASQDIAIVDLFYETGGATITPPTGFTLDATITRPATVLWKHDRFWKRLTGADTGSYTFGLSVSQQVMIGCGLYSGRVASGSPFDVATVTGASAGTSMVACPSISITPVTTGVDLVYGNMNYHAGGGTAPAGWTNAATHVDGVLQCYKANQASGSSGSVACTSPAADQWTVMLSALVPPGGAAAVSRVIQRNPARGLILR